MRKRVYNLEFPPWCPAMTIHGYRFIRVKEYRERVVRLQPTSGSSIEFSVAASPGQHAVTSYVEIPAAEEKSVLPWNDRDNTTALNDILLLLSIFTRRDVFAVDDASMEEAEGLWTADPRLHIGGGILRSSIIYREGGPVNGEVYDIGFEEGVAEVCSLIREEHWQRKYADGYLLFLALHAFKSELLEAAVAQCWTIWEHLFSLHHREHILCQETKGADDRAKLLFLLEEHDLAEQVTGDEWAEQVAQLREAIVHSGRIPEGDQAQRDALFFLRLTEVLLAQILELSPSNVLGTHEAWEWPPGNGRTSKMPVFGVLSGRI